MSIWLTSGMCFLLAVLRPNSSGVSMTSSLLVSFAPLGRTTDTESPIFGNERLLFKNVYVPVAITIKSQVLGLVEWVYIQF